jgi:HD superfamily phosphodiesterase
MQVFKKITQKSFYKKKQSCILKTTAETIPQKGVFMINELHSAMIHLYGGDAKRIQHFCKVHGYAKLIAEMEKIDGKTQFILEAAALTHDIGIHLCEKKYGDCSGKLQEKEGPGLAKKMLSELNFDESVSERVQFLIAHHHTYSDVDGIDYQILIEADFLVNLYEDNASVDGIKNAYENIFRTESGKKICREMFCI